MSIPTSNVKYIALEVLLTGIGTAGSFYVVCPVDGTIRAIYSTLDAVVDGDNTLTFSIGSTAITGSTIVHPVATTAAGELRESFPTGANHITRGQVIKATTDGGGTVGEARVTFLIEQD